MTRQLRTENQINAQTAQNCTLMSGALGISCASAWTLGQGRLRVLKIPRQRKCMLGMRENLPGGEDERESLLCPAVSRRMA